MLPSTSVEPKLLRFKRRMTFNLPPTSKIECRDVRVVEQSLSQEVLRFHGGGVMAILIAEGGVMYVDN